MPRHGIAVQPEFYELLHGRGVKHRQPVRRYGLLALMRDSGTLTRMVVTEHQQHAALGRRALAVAVFDRVASTVHTGTLAVPQGEYAIDLRLRQQVQLLRTPNRSSRQVFVHARFEANIGGLQPRPFLLHLQVQSAERRATVAAHKARGIQAGGSIALALQQQQAHQRLVAIQ